MSRNGFEAIIVGGGIVGAACALELARSGVRPLVIETGEIGGGATAAGMGHLVVMDDSDAQFALTRYSMQLWDELIPELSSDCEPLPSGTLWVAADEEEMDEVRRKQSFYAARAVHVEVLDERQLREAEPGLRAGLVGGLLVPGDGVVYSPCVARWLLERAVELGAEVREGVEVAGLAADGARLHNGSTISAGIVINAAGCRAPELTPGIPIQKRKGHLAITDRYPGYVNHQLIELGYLKSAHSVSADSVAFNAQPRLTGQILIGSSRQFGVDDPAVEQRMLRWMLARAIEYLPGLGSLSVLRTWTGFRPATPDNLPLIGRVTGQQTEGGAVWVAAGHEGLGITTSLGSAMLLVDQILGRPSAIPVEPYLPSRSIAQHIAHYGEDHHG